ncbi:hypothetical protein AYO38_06290 [bacterium SCGC AG-212-C10]|nr:hypothetical protein AYO38_06290 [bacterium SCGC AG-212-C10]
MPDVRLTGAEQRLLDQLRLGVPDAESAVRMGISVGDFKERVERLMTRLELANRAELIAWTPALPPAPDEAKWSRPADADEGEGEPGQAVGEPVAAASPASRAAQPESASVSAPVAAKAAAPKRSRRAVLAGGAAAVVVAGGAAAGFALARRRPGEGISADSKERATAVATPQTTRAPAGSGPQLGLITEEVGAFQRTLHASGQPFSVTHGIFSMDVDSGITTGWSLDSQLLAEGLPTYALSPGGRFIRARASRAEEWLYDRVDDRTFRWPTKSLTLAAMGRESLLFAELESSDSPNASWSGRYAITDQHGGDLVRFELPPPGPFPVAPVFGPEDETVLIPGISDTGSPVLRHINALDGSFIRTVQVPFERAGGRLVSLESRHGRSYALAHSTLPAESAAESDTNQESRFDWSLSSLYTNFPSPAFTDVSPDGRLECIEDSLQERTPSGADLIGPISWPAVTIREVAGGRPLARIRSATLSYGDGLGSRRWLADSSGITVRVRESSDELGPLQSAGYRTFMVPVQGKSPPLGLLPQPPALPLGTPQWFTTPHVMAPVPSPIRPDLVSFGHVALFNRTAGNWFRANIPGDGPTHIDPWSGRADEMVFGLPHGGHDGGAGAVMLDPLIEYPPFADTRRLNFVVAGAGDCLNLRESPSVQGAIRTCYPDGTPLTLSADAASPAHLHPSVRFAETELWVYVDGPGGNSGWVSTRFLAWAV